MHNKKTDLFMALRGFAISLIVWWHVYVPNTPEIFLWAIGPYWMFSSTGYLGVWIFIFLSGYLNGKSFYNHKYPLTFRGIFRFYLKRFLTIAPLYYLTLFYLILRYKPMPDFPTDSVVHFLAFYAEQDIGIPYLGYLWFIAVIAQLYALTPLLYLVNIQSEKFRPLRHLPKIFAGIALLGYPLWEYYLIGNWDQDTYKSHFYSSLQVNLGYYYAGLYLNYIEKRVSFKKLAKSPALTNGIIAVLISSLYLIVTYYTYHFFFEFTKFLYLMMIILPAITVMALSFIVLIHRAGTGNTQPKSVLNTGVFPTVFSFIGQYAYPMYLLHYPILFFFKFSCWEYCRIRNLVFREITVFLLALILAVFLKQITLLFQSLSPKTSGKT